MSHNAAHPVDAALDRAARALQSASDSPRLDAELLMAHALGVERAALLLDPARFAVPPEFAALVERRARREPVAYILGYQDFWTIRLVVGPGALIPRPDSETLIEAALAHFPDRAAPLRILDLGTGPGTLLLTALSEFPQAHGLGVDASESALGYARLNAQALGLSDRIDLRLGDWASGLGGEFDLILCNPPYVEDDAALEPDVRDYEPASALFAGAEGLDDYRRIIPQLPPLLAPGGRAILEIGWQQAAPVGALAQASGFAFTVRHDLAGRDRTLVLGLS